LKDTIILTDEPTQKDHRVLKTIKLYDKPIIIDCRKIDILKYSKLKTVFFEIILLIKSLLFSFYYWKILYIKYKIKPKGFLAGLKKSIYFHIKSKQVSSSIQKQYQMKEIQSIYTNDLFCGTIGNKLYQQYNTPYIYDAHEVEFHRNRKNGFLRVTYDILLEKEVIQKAQKIIVVNKPIKELYMDIYHIPENKISIVDNNHFTPYLGYALKHFSPTIQEVAITYVGGGILGRKLEALAQEANKLNINIYSYFLVDPPKLISEYNWYLGSKDYLKELLELCTKTHLAMWSCTEDICLSYRLSLPNKFFQAMAIGIPVIAYKGTYLSEIVKKYNLGYIYDDTNFHLIIEKLKNNKEYYNLLESIAIFQEKLFIDKLEL
jgi:glycosyltransferase involved in cell wall biosynthesis